MTGAPQAVPPSRETRRRALVPRELEIVAATWVGVLVFATTATRVLGDPGRWLAVTGLVVATLGALCRVRHARARVWLWSVVQAGACISWMAGPGGVLGVGAAVVGVAAGVSLTVASRSQIAWWFTAGVTVLGVVGTVVRVAEGAW